MARTISIGRQDYEGIRTNGCFYVDKTGFVRDWWLSNDDATLICRPRRFGKTLNLDTVRCFLSTDYAGRGRELFSGLEVWEDRSMRALQGTVPVVLLSFARVKQDSFPKMLRRINRVICEEVETHGYLRAWPNLSEHDRANLSEITNDMPADTCANAISTLCSLLYRYHGVKPVVLLDEYDTPMQEAWLGGFWDEASHFMRDLMNSTFKTNRSMGRGLITGVTRLSRESIFSDLNNLEVVTTSSPSYQTCFGFTQDEVDAALVEYGLDSLGPYVKEWYDGFTFGGVGDIYNPWSVTKFLNSGTLDTYWANTSSNGLASSVVRHGDTSLKRDFEDLLRGASVEKALDEQVVVSELARRPNAVWALLLAAGYLTAPGPVPLFIRKPRRLELTNYEVELTFDTMIQGWFAEAGDSYDEFCNAILSGDKKVATLCLNEVTCACISSFDGGRKTAASEPERFYHGLVLGLLTQLRGRYAVESNRESGYGRYDVIMEESQM